MGKPRSLDLPSMKKPVNTGFTEQTLVTKKPNLIHTNQFLTSELKKDICGQLLYEVMKSHLIRFHIVLQTVISKNLQGIYSTLCNYSI